jgi:hypothetical protein
MSPTLSKLYPKIEAILLRRVGCFERIGVQQLYFECNYRKWLFCMFRPQSKSYVAENNITSSFKKMSLFIE